MADIRLAKPAAGTSQNVVCTPDARFVFEFPTDEATLSRNGDNLVITFEDGSTLQLENFYTAYSSENMPSFSVDGAEISGQDFFTAMNEPDLMPAAGPAGNAGNQSNGNRFHDYVNADLLDGLDRLGGLDIGWPGSDVNPETDGAATSGDYIPEEIDTVPPTVSITLGLTTSNGDKILNIEEAAANESVTLRGTVTVNEDATNVPDTVELKLGDKVLGHAELVNNGDGTYSYELKVDGSEFKDSTVQQVTTEIIVSDAAGNTAHDEASDSFTQDTTAPEATIDIDTIAGDDTINQEESTQETTTITGTVGKDVKPGDTVTVTVEGSDTQYTTTVTDEFTWSVDVSTSDLMDGQKVHASVTTTDDAGNSVTATDERPVDVDTTAPTITDANIMVDEGALDDGSGQHKEHGDSSSGSFTVNLNNEDGTITLVNGDQKVELKVENGQFSKPDPATITVNGVEVTVTGARQEEGGSWKVTYDYKLTGDQSHTIENNATGGAGHTGDEDALISSITIDVTDAADNKAEPGALIVEVHDDGPVVRVEDDSVVEVATPDVEGSATGTLDGHFTINHGADGPADEPEFIFTDKDGHEHILTERTEEQLKDSQTAPGNKPDAVTDLEDPTKTESSMNPSPTEGEPSAWHRVGLGNQERTRIDIFTRTVEKTYEVTGEDGLTYLITEYVTETCEVTQTQERIWFLGWQEGDWTNLQPNENSQWQPSGEPTYTWEAYETVTIEGEYSCTVGEGDDSYTVTVKTDDPSGDGGEQGYTYEVTYNADSVNGSGSAIKGALHIKAEDSDHDVDESVIDILIQKDATNLVIGTEDSENLIGDTDYAVNIIAGDDIGASQQMTGEPGKAYNICIMLDLSGSMADGLTDGSENVGMLNSRMYTAVEALKSFFQSTIQNHDGEVNLRLIGFGSSLEEGLTLKIPAGADEAVRRAIYNEFSNQLDYWLNDMFDSGYNQGTNYEAALHEANNWFNGKDGENNIAYFISDGEPTYRNNDNGHGTSGRGGSYTDRDEVKEALDEAINLDEKGVEINAIGIGTGLTNMGKEILNLIDNTGGTGATTNWYPYGNTRDPSYDSYGKEITIGDAQIVTEKDDLVAELEKGATALAVTLDDAGDDTIHAATAGIVYGDTVNTDMLSFMLGIATDSSVNLPYGSGYALFEYLEGKSIDLDKLQLSPDLYAILSATLDDGAWSHATTIKYMELFAEQMAWETKVLTQENEDGLEESTFYLIDLEGNIYQMTEEGLTESTVDVSVLEGRENGNDVIYGSVEDSLLFGQEGHDLLFGDGSTDTLNNINEILNTDASDADALHNAISQVAKTQDTDTLDKLIASVEGTDADGNDQLYGGSGNDVIFGMGGDDYIVGGSGEDIVFAGSGNDIIVYDGSDYLIDGGSGLDVMIGDGSTPSLDALLGKTTKPEGQPIVNDVEVLIRGENALSLTSIDALKELGITITHEDAGGRVELSDAWSYTETKGDVVSYTNGDGLTVDINTAEVEVDSSIQDMVDQAAQNIANSNG